MNKTITYDPSVRGLGTPRYFGNVLLAAGDNVLSEQQFDYVTSLPFWADYLADGTFATADAVTNQTPSELSPFTGKDTLGTVTISPADISTGINGASKIDDIITELQSGAAGLTQAQNQAAVSAALTADANLGVLPNIVTNTSNTATSLGLIQSQTDQIKADFTTLIGNVDDIEVTLGSPSSVAGANDILGQLKTIVTNTASSNVSLGAGTVDANTQRVTLESGQLSTLTPLSIGDQTTAVTAGLDASVDIEAIKASLAVLEADSSSVSLNAGVVDATTQRVTLATDDAVAVDIAATKVSNDDILAALTAVDTAVPTSTVGNAGVAATVALAANAARKEVFIQNKSDSDNLYISNTGTASITDSITLFPGEKFAYIGIDAQQAISVIALVANVPYYIKENI